MVYTGVMDKIKPCLQCGKTIKKPQNESLKNWLNRHKYCSKICLGKSFVHLKEHRFKIGHKFGKRIKKGQHLSPKTQFKKGAVPWNKDIEY